MPIEFNEELKKFQLKEKVLNKDKVKSMTDNKEEIVQALKLASEALGIASDWNLDELEVGEDLPESWKNDVDTDDGMCRTYDLKKKFEQLASELEKEK